jgi:hypothetical protein
MSDCDCGENELGLFGRGDCTRIVRYTKRLAFMHKYDSAGNKNFINFDDGSGALKTIDEIFWDALLRETDASKRLYLTPIMENVAEDGTDEEVQTMDSGRSFVTRDAFLSFEGYAPEKDASYELYREWKKNKCADLVFFYIDASGSIFGSDEGWEDLKLFPIPVSDGSFRVFRMPAKASEVAMIRVRFDWDNSFNDANIVGVYADAQDENLLTLSPMARVIGISTVPATISLLTVFLRSNVIDNLTADPITGLLLANFVILSEAGVPIVPSSVTEISAGNYEIDGTYVSGESVTGGINLNGHVMRPVTFMIP